MHLIDHPEISGIYNAGFENISIKDIASLISKKITAEISVTPSNDPRSYRINSDKILATGFRPKKTVDDAIKEIIQKFKNNELKDEDHFYNLKWMQKTVLTNK